MSNNPAKYEELIQQYLCSILETKKTIQILYHTTICNSLIIVLEYADSYCALVLEEVSNKPVVSSERYGRNNTIR